MPQYKNLADFKLQNPQFAGMDSYELARQIYDVRADLKEKGVSFENFAKAIGAEEDAIRRMEDRGVAGELGVAVKRGVRQGIATGFKAVHEFMPEGWGPSEEFIDDVEEELTTDPGYTRGRLTATSKAMDYLTQGVEQGVQSLTAAAPGIAAGALLATSAPVSGPGALGAMALGAATSGGTLFAGAEHHDFMEEAHQLLDGQIANQLMAAGKPEQQAWAEARQQVEEIAEPKALISAAAEGGFEGLSNFLDIKIFGGGLKGMTGPVKRTVKEKLMLAVKQYFKTTGKAVAVEVPSEMATTAVQHEAYKPIYEQAGIPVPDFGKQLEETAITTALATATVFGPLGVGGQFAGRSKQVGTLRKLGYSDDAIGKMDQESIDKILKKARQDWEKARDAAAKTRGAQQPPPSGGGGAGVSPTTPPTMPAGGSKKFFPDLLPAEGATGAKKKLDQPATVQKRTDDAALQTGSTISPPVDDQGQGKGVARGQWDDFHVFTADELDQMDRTDVRTLAASRNIPGHETKQVKTLRNDILAHQKRDAFRRQQNQKLIRKTKADNEGFDVVASNEIPEDLRDTFDLMRGEVDTTETRGVARLPDGSQKGFAASSPKWMTDLNEQMRGQKQTIFSRGEIRRLIELKKTGQELTDRQQVRWDHLEAAAKKLRDEHPDLVANDDIGYIEKKGFTFVGNEKMVVADLEVGDRIYAKIDGVEDEYEHVGFNDKGDVILQDGKKKVVDFFEVIEIQGIKRKTKTPLPPQAVSPPPDAGPPIQIPPEEKPGEQKELWQMSREEWDKATTEKRYGQFGEKGVALNFPNGQRKWVRVKRDLPGAIESARQENYARMLSDAYLVDKKPVPLALRKAADTAVENWEQTYDEYADPIRDQYKGSADEAAMRKMHREAVENALKEGKPVPAEVLAEYPDLEKTSPPPDEGKPEEKRWDDFFPGDIKGTVDHLPDDIKQEIVKKLHPLIARRDAYAASKKSKWFYMAGRPVWATNIEEKLGGMSGLVERWRRQKEAIDKGYKRANPERFQKTVQDIWDQLDIDPDDQAFRPIDPSQYPKGREGFAGKQASTDGPGKLKMTNIHEVDGVEVGLVWNYTNQDPDYWSSTDPETLVVEMTPEAAARKHKEEKQRSKEFSDRLKNHVFTADELEQESRWYLRLLAFTRGVPGYQNKHLDKLRQEILDRQKLDDLHRQKGQQAKTPPPDEGKAPGVSRVVPDDDGEDAWTAPAPDDEDGKPWTGWGLDELPDEDVALDDISFVDGRVPGWPNWTDAREAAKHLARINLESDNGADREENLRHFIKLQRILTNVKADPRFAKAMAENEDIKDAVEHGEMKPYDPKTDHWGPAVMAVFDGAIAFGPIRDIINWRGFKKTQSGTQPKNEWGDLLAVQPIPKDVPLLSGTGDSALRLSAILLPRNKQWQKHVTRNEFGGILKKHGLNGSDIVSGAMKTKWAWEDYLKDKPEVVAAIRDRLGLTPDEFQKSVKNGNFAHLKKLFNEGKLAPAEKVKGRQKFPRTKEERDFFKELSGFTPEALGLDGISAEASPGTQMGLDLKAPTSIPASTPTVTPAEDNLEKDDFGEPVKPLERGVAVYSSGVGGRLEDLEGAIEARVPITVLAQDLMEGKKAYKEKIEDIVEYVNVLGGKVLLDSGAFPLRDKGGPDFNDVLDVYFLIVGSVDRENAKNITVVAPDVVGDQAETFGVQELNSYEVKLLAARGAKVLIPVQKGELPAYDAWQKSLGIFKPEIPNPGIAIPSSDAVMDNDDLRNLLSGEEKPPWIHFLGMGTDNGKFAAKLAIIEELAPNTVVTADANQIRANVGRKGYVRQITKDSDRLKKEYDEERFQSQYPVDQQYRQSRKDAVRKALRQKALPLGDEAPGSEAPVETPDADGYISLEEAEAKIQEWKDFAWEVGDKKGQQDRTILSLFDRTGVWSKPWADAGYTVIQIDNLIEGGKGFGYEQDISKIDIDWIHDHIEDTVDGVLAAPPCTDFAASGARWWKAKDMKGVTDESLELVFQVFRIIEYLQPDFWVIENPVGRLPTLIEGMGKPQMYFHPHHFGFPYTKKTGLWGDFNTALPTANVRPTEGSYAHKLRGDDPVQKAARSITPEGFAYAFFMANHPVVQQGFKSRMHDDDAAQDYLDYKRVTRFVPKGGEPSENPADWLAPDRPDDPTAPVPAPPAPTEDNLQKVTYDEAAVADLKKKAKEAYTAGNLEIPHYMAVIELLHRKEYDKVEEILAAIGEEGPNLAEKIKARSGANEARLLKLIGRQMYKGALVSVTVKECCQNAFDAVKELTQQKGKARLKDGKIDIAVDKDKRIIAIRDNGVGMSLATIQDAFLKIAGTDKGGLEDPSGSFGMAKAVFLYGTEWVKVTTKKRGGKRYTLQINGMGSYGKDIEIEADDAPADEHGTTIVIKIPKVEIVDGKETEVRFPYDIGGIDFFKKPMVHPDIEVRLYDGYLPQEAEDLLTDSKSVAWEQEFRTLPLGRNYDLSGYEKYTTAKFAWGKADLYIGVERKEGWNKVGAILSSGIYQFDHGFYGPNYESIPYDIIVNVTPTVKAEEATYPFNIRREGWKDLIEEDVKALSFYIFKVAMGREAESTAATFKDIKALPRVDIEDVGGIDIDIHRYFKQDPKPAQKTPVKTDWRPAAIDISKGRVTGKNEKGETQVYVDTQKRDASFKADREAPTAKDFLLDVGIDDKLPVFHNNTNIDYFEEAKKAGFATSQAESMFAEFGSLLVKMKEIVADRMSYGYETLKNEDRPFFVGISMDKGYHGVNLITPFYGVLVNPLAFKSDTIPGIATGYFITFVHEFAHVSERNHGDGFTAEMSRVEVKLSEDGTDLEMKTALMRFVKKHKGLLKALRTAYERSSTKNIAKSLHQLQKGGGVAEDAGHGRVAGPGRDQSGAVQAGKRSEERQALLRYAGDRERGQDGGPAQGNAQDVDSDIRYKAEAEAGAPSGQKKSGIQKALAPLKIFFSEETWGSIKTVQSVADLPQAILKHMDRHNTFRAPGVFYRGLIYLIADNIANTRQALTLALSHELRHKGIYNLRNQLAEKYDDAAKANREINRALNNIYMKRAKEIRKLGEPGGDYYGLFDGLSPGEQKRRLAEEWIADNPQAFGRDQWYDRYMAAVRDLFRAVMGKLGYDLELSDAEIRDFLRQSTEALRGPVVGKSNGVRFMKGGAADAPTWYSQMQRVLAVKLPNKGPVKQVIAQLKAWAKKGEFKGEELEWSGLIEWLERKSGRVTKQEVLAYVAANNLRLVEKKRGGIGADERGRPAPELVRQWAALQMQKWSVEKDEEGIYVALDPEGNPWRNERGRPWSFSSEAAARMALRDRFEGEGRRKPANDLLADFGFAPIKSGGPAMHPDSNLQVPGERENYTEFLVILDSGTGGVNPHLANERLMDYLDDLYVKYSYNEKTPVTDIAQLRRVLTPEEATELARLEADLEDGMADMDDAYFSDHWEEPNILAHVRFTERVLPDGRRVLFLEEVQSDWLQEGRKRGFKQLRFASLEEATKALKRKSPQAEWVDQGNGEYHAKGLPVDSTLVKRDDGWFELKRALGSIPDAPWKKTWGLKMVQRMVRYAAENGFDAVAWTPGSIQIDRYEYGLSRNVDEIQYHKYPSGAVDLVATKDGKKVFDRQLNRNRYTITELSDGRQWSLEELVGKKVAQEIEKAAVGPGTLKSEDIGGLSIGGQGFKSFYDEELVNEANRFFNKKKWGNAKVEGSKILTDQYTVETEYTESELGRIADAYLHDAMQDPKWEESRQYRRNVRQIAKDVRSGRLSVNHSTFGEYPNVRPLLHKIQKGTADIHTLPLTPEMKQKSLAEGFPLFSRKISDAEYNNPARLVNKRIEKKYADILGLPEVGEVSGALEGLLEKIDERETTPKEIQTHLQGAAEKDKVEVANQIRSVIADQIGDLIETHKYEGHKEGRGIEKYLDGLLKAVYEVVPRDSLSDRGAPAEAAETEKERRLSSDSGIDKDQQQDLPLYSLSITPEMREKAAVEDMPLFQVNPDQPHDWVAGDLPAEIVNRHVEDMGRRERVTVPPHWLAKKYPRFFGRMYEAQRHRVKEMLRRLSKSLEETKLFWGLDRTERDMLSEIIFTLDNNPIPGLPKWMRTYKRMDGETGIYLNPYHYVELKKYLLAKQVPQRVADTFVQLRQSLDKDLLTVFHKLRDNPDVDRGTVEAFRKAMGQIHNYFPHIRYGNHYLKISDPSEVDPHTGNPKVRYYTHFNMSSLKTKGVGKAGTLGDRRAQKVLAKALKENPHLKGLKVEVGRVKKMPEEVFGIPIPIEAIEQVVAAAADRITDNETRAALRAMLPEAVANELKARGWGSHMIRRKNIPGMETADIKRVLFDYKVGLYGWLTKMDAAKDFSGILASIPSKVFPQEYGACRQFSYDMLRNSDGLDRFVANLKSVFFVKYLGLNIKTAALNLTQNIIVGYPRLGMEVSGASGKLALTLWKRSMGRISEVWGGVDNLTENEKKLFKELLDDGTTQANYIHEVMGQAIGGPRNAWGQFVRFMGLPMTVAERFNRTSLALAAYRAARDGQIDNEETLKEFGARRKARHEKRTGKVFAADVYKPGEKWEYEDAKNFAERVIDDSHFVYGKSNRPELFRGSAAGRTANAGYTFRTYSHNLINAWTNMLRNGSRGQMAFAKSMAATAVIGGLTSIPLYKTFMHVIRQLTGDDWGEEYIFSKLSDEDSHWMRDLAAYGVPGLVGINMGGSLGMELPIAERMDVHRSLTQQFLTNFGEVVGIPYALLSDGEMAIRALNGGDWSRASEYVLPAGLANLPKSYRLYAEGLHTISGSPIARPGANEAIKIGFGKAVARSLGFTDTMTAKSWDLGQKMRDFREYRLNVQSRFANRLANAWKDRDQERAKKVLEELGEWNRKQLEAGHPEYVVDLKQALRSRLRSQQPPKYLWPKMFEISKSMGLLEGDE